MGIATRGGFCYSKFGILICLSIGIASGVACSLVIGWFARPPAADRCTCLSMAVVDIVKVLMVIVGAGFVARCFRSSGVAGSEVAAGSHAASNGGHDVPQLGQGSSPAGCDAQCFGQGPSSAPTAPVAAAAPRDADLRSGIHITIGKGDMPVEDSENLVKALGTIAFRDGKLQGSTFQEVMTTDPAYGKWVKGNLNKGLDRVFLLYTTYCDLTPQ